MDATGAAMAVGLDPESALSGRLRARRVRVRVDGPEAVILQRVPANRRYFNKPATNLMVRRARPNLPILVAVDQDLEYTGPDPVLLRAFAGGATQQGWRIIFANVRSEGPFEGVVSDALRVVGFDDEEPAWNPVSGRLAAQPTAGEAAAPRVLDRVGRIVPTAAVEGEGRGRPMAENALAAVVGLRPRLPVFVGPPGAGKSHALGCLAALLSGVAPGSRLSSVDLNRLFAGALLESERENLLVAVLEEAAADDHLVLVLEPLDLVARDTRHGPGLLAAAIEQGQRVVGTMAGGAASVFDDTPLARHLHPVTVNAASVDEACAVLRTELARIAGHHHVEVPDELVRPLAERAATLAGTLPATVLDLADVACARARIGGREAVGIADVSGAASTFERQRE